MSSKSDDETQPPPPPDSPAAPAPDDSAEGLATRFDKVQELTTCPNCLDSERFPIVAGTLVRDTEVAFRIKCSACNGRTTTQKAFRAIVYQAEFTATVRDNAISDMERPSGIEPKEFVHLSQQMASLALENADLRKEIDTLRGNGSQTTLVDKIKTLSDELLVQQAAIQAENRASHDETAKAIDTLSKRVDRGHKEVPKARSPPSPALPAPEVQPQRQNTTEGSTTNATTTVRLSYRDIARKNLPPSFKISGLFDEIVRQKIPQIRSDFVRSVTTSDKQTNQKKDQTAVKAIYVKGAKRGPIGKLSRALRSVLPVQAVRGLCYYGYDSFELLVDEDLEQHAREFVKLMGFTPTINTGALSDDPSDKEVHGLLRRWRRCMCNARGGAKRWYREQLAAVSARFPGVSVQESIEPDLD